MPHSEQKTRVETLRRLASLISQATETVIAEWENGTAAAESIDGVQLPSRALFDAQRTLLAAAGSIEEIVGDPATRLISFSMQFFESRALHIAAEHRVPDVLRHHDDEGLHLARISQSIGVEERKLARILRLLCSQHIFREVAPDAFANNAISRALVGNEDLRAYIMMMSLNVYSGSDLLPVALTDAKLGPSYNANETAFNLAAGTDLPRWDWLAIKVPKSQAKRLDRLGYRHSAQPKGHEDPASEEDELVQRPELDLFSRAMVGGGRVFSSAHVFDYPWHELGAATVVDVGGGVGGFPLQLSKAHPLLSFVVQDHESTIEQGKAFWAQKNPQALASGRVRLMAHDFFQENPIKNAEVYWLRYIMHDWSDDYCIRILRRVREAMGSNSKLLIADQVMNTTLGCDELEAAPDPLLPNYGSYVRYSHQRDLVMMSMLNGIERTPAQFKSLLAAAGLYIKKIWECRTQVSVMECAKSL